MRTTGLFLLLGGCSVEMVGLEYEVHEALTGNALEGVEVCEWPDAEPCFRSDALGMVTVEVEAGSDVFATMELDGFYGRFFSFQAPEESAYMGENALMTSVAAEFLYGVYDVEKVPGTGLIGASALTPDRESGVAGIEIILDPPEGGRVITVDESGTFSKELEVTTEVGAAGWFNVPPGEYTMTFVAPVGVTCTRVFGLEADEPHQAGLQVIADHWTHVDAVCD
jgi:hypothetical protein